MDKGDNGILELLEDQWQAVPSTNDGSIISKDIVSTVDVEFTFRIFEARTVKGEQVWDMEIGEAQSFTLKYHPGKPVTIAQVIECVCVCMCVCVSE